MKVTTKQADALVQALEGLLDNDHSDPAAWILRMSAARQAAKTLLAEIRTPTAEVTINIEQSLYVIPCNNGYTCLGFDVLLARHNAVAAWLIGEGLQAQGLPIEVRGTLHAYTAYRNLMLRTQAYCQRNNLRCPAELTPGLIGLEGKRVKVVDCYGERRRFQVGKSTGWMPCHLMIARRGSTGGPAVFGTPFQSVQVIA
jgi:hypothetical protein